MSAFAKSFAYGSQTVTIETGELARQADASVKVSMGDTVVLVTCVAKTQPVPGRDFFPLTVNYIEKTYAAGKLRDSKCATTPALNESSVKQCIRDQAISGHRWVFL